MTHAYIGLGSNLDNPAQQVKDAFAELHEIANTELLEHSPLYASTPVGPAGQPNYINACALIDTQLSPIELLDALQGIENAHQRVRKEHWGPRTLDLDLLLFGRQVIDSERLKVPHPYLCERNFVLYPLADISVPAQMPSGVTIESLRASCSDSGLRLLD